MSALKCSAAVLAALLTSNVWAKGLVVDGSEMNSTQRSELLKHIEKARRDDPGAFSALEVLFAKLPRADAGKRGLYAVMTPALKALGTRGLYPILDALTFNGQDLREVTPSAQESWRLALLDAVGLLRSPEAEPVLVAALRTEGLTERERLVASIALGRLQSDTAVQFLVGRLSMANRAAALTGLGETRRLTAVHALTNFLAGQASEAEAKAAAKALGEAGSSWAWKVSGDRSEGAAVRAASAEALVHAFVRSTGEVRIASAGALMRVDASNTPALLEAAKAANPDQAAELAALEVRFANNPAR